MPTTTGTGARERRAESGGPARPRPTRYPPSGPRDSTADTPRSVGRRFEPAHTEVMSAAARLLQAAASTESADNFQVYADRQAGVGRDCSTAPVKCVQGMAPLHPARVHRPHARTTPHPLRRRHQPWPAQGRHTRFSDTANASQRAQMYTDDVESVENWPGTRPRLLLVDSLTGEITTRCKLLRKNVMARATGTSTVVETMSDGPASLGCNSRRWPVDQRRP